MEQGAVRAWPAPYRVAGEAYGVRVLLSTDSAEAFARIQELLPPGWMNHDAADFSRRVEERRNRDRETLAARQAGRAELHVEIVDPNKPVDPRDRIPHFNLISQDGLEYVLKRDDTVLARSGLDVVIDVLDAQLRGYIALLAKDRIFVHAGVVGHRGRAIVIPGPSFSGKTSLVTELVRSGATYYSDEYAVLDDSGQVHPYPKPLSIRTNSWTATEHHVTTLGGVVGVEPLPLGLIVVAQYRPGATWEPEELSSGEAVLALLANTVPARDRPDETMKALRQVVDGSGAVALQGERGEASEMIASVLERVST